jgi:predicted nucleotidyltransferase
MLEALIASRTRVKLLTLFLLNPESEFYVREIVRITAENMNSVRRELANLESFGLVTGQKKGIQQYYTVNRDFFLYEELQKIVIKTEGVARHIKENLTALDEIQCMFIYGSFATGNAGAKSDIDLFIIGSVDESRLIPLVHESERALHREINYTLMKPDELKKRQRTGDPFVKNVMKEPKIMIIGTCDD